MIFLYFYHHSPIYRNFPKILIFFSKYLISIIRYSKIDFIFEFSDPKLPIINHKIRPNFLNSSGSAKSKKINRDVTTKSCYELDHYLKHGKPIVKTTTTNIKMYKSIQLMSLLLFNSTHYF